MINLCDVDLVTISGWSVGVQVQRIRGYEHKPYVCRMFSVNQSDDEVQIATNCEVKIEDTRK